MNKRASLSLTDIGEIFAKDGILKQALKDYEVRSAQKQLALLTAKAFNSGRILVAEAGTGIGKTFSYLVPCLLLIANNCGPVVISTYTKNLQMQLFYKDLKLIKDVLGLELKEALLMGRGNYLCLHRLNTLHQKQEQVPLGLLPRINDWKNGTETGLVEEWPFSQYPQLWTHVASDQEFCFGQYCRFQTECFIQKARKEAQEADIVIINHHLFFSDLQVKNSNEMMLLPNYRYIVFDEAHNLEKAGVGFFGVNFEQKVVEEYIGETEKSIPFLQKADEKIASLQEFLLRIKELKEVAHYFFFIFKERLEGNKQKILENSWRESIETHYDQLQNALYQVNQSLAEKEERLSPEGRDIIREKTAFGNKLRSQLSHFFSDNLDNYVLWLEEDSESLALKSLPLKISGFMNSLFFPKIEGALFTSATLSVNEDTTFFTHNLGFPRERTEQAIFISPFDYFYQLKVLIPTRMPSPGSKHYTRDCLVYIKTLLPYCGPRILFLFTSYEMLNDFKQRIELMLAQAGYNLLVQGRGTPNSLIKKFKEQKKAVLLGTSSFWEGVDLPGSHLTTVVMLRLPFPVPGEPWIAGKSKQLDEEGKNSFYHLMLPQAVIRFKQGWGRLIRSFRDRGLLIIFDSRLLTKSYGSFFRNALPPGGPVVTGELEELVAAARSFAAQEGK